MGQMTTGIFYGCEAVDGLRLREECEDDGEGPGLIDKWKALPKAERGTLELDDLHGDGDKLLFGFWIAVAGEGEAGAEKATDIYGKCIPFDKLTQSKRAQSAIAAWPRVTALLKQLHVAPLVAQFWIVPIEVA